MQKKLIIFIIYYIRERKDYMRSILFLVILLLGCAEVVSDQVNESTEKSVRGSECSPGCIWSTYAVSSGVQRLTHFCDGEGCHCVEIGNVYGSCHETQTATQETEQQTSWVEQEEQQQSLQNDYNSYKGNRLADEAYYEASRRGTVGWCYNAVADAVERITGRFLWGSHAYQAADQFAASNHFYEVWGRDLRTLPAGAIVVWGQGSSRSGHISVALGNGQEASDHIASQMTYHYGGAPSRVFLPR